MKFKHLFLGLTITVSMFATGVLNAEVPKKPIAINKKVIVGPKLTVDPAALPEIDPERLRCLIDAFNQCESEHRGYINNTAPINDRVELSYNLRRMRCDLFAMSSCISEAEAKVIQSILENM